MTNFLDIIYRLFLIKKNTRRFGDWSMSPSSGKRTSTLLGPIDRASPETGATLQPGSSSFRLPSCRHSIKNTAVSQKILSTIFLVLYKDAICGKKSDDDEEVISEVKRWLRQRPAEWYCEGIQALISRWRKVIDSEGDYVEK
jgi:hypothetical protein